MQTHSPLERLAALLGVLPRYVDQTGTETRVTTDETRVAILGAMGIDASTGEKAKEALEALESREWARALAPVCVVRRSDADAASVSLRVREGSEGPAAWTLELHPEHGEPVRLEGTTQPEWNGTVRIDLPFTPPEGYHTLRVTARTPEDERSGEQSLIVVPDRCVTVPEVADRDRVFGVTVNLYTVRSEGNWGIGDLSDLGRLLEWTAAEGGEFVGVNPLHALRNRGGDISPYSPVSRVFRNPVYLDVAAVPELRDSAEARRLLEADEARRERESLRAGDRVEYERVSTLKRRALEALHRAFAAGEGGERREAYEEFARRQGEPLALFATFEALVDHLGEADWRRWPERFRRPDSAEVRDFRERNAEAVDFHRWVQFELDRQLGRAAARGERAGLRIGLYQDLAIGTSPVGADVWAEPDLFVTGASIGAPPDEYSATGQNWGLPPLNPWALKEDAFRYWIRLVRASMRHAGALRIDHAVGLFRQFWIPEGMEGKDGAYVRFPARDLLGILALESRRHGAVVVGEDLGTVPAEVPPVLKEWSVHSSRVFYFEREGESFRPAESYEPLALATANTHDMPTLDGFWRGRDIEIKREVGIIESDDAAEEQRGEREKERRAVLECLAAEGLLPEARDPEEPGSLRGAVHAFLCRTPSAMVGFSLDDLVGEVEPVNVPGVPPEEVDAWTRKLSTPVEAFADDPEVRASLRCEGRARSRSRPE